MSDKVNETVSGTSKEANKQVAKDSDASLGTRASAAKDALGDKMDETSNSVRTSLFVTSRTNTDFVPQGLRHCQQGAGQARISDGLHRPVTWDEERQDQSRANRSVPMTPFLGCR